MLILSNHLMFRFKDNLIGLYSMFHVDKLQNGIERETNSFNKVFLEKSLFLGIGSLGKERYSSSTCV